MIFEKQIEKIYRSKMFCRCDDAGLARYFSYEDFAGMICEPFSFKGREGHTLNGAFYSYENCREDKLIVFDHGMGGGHRSYMREIEVLCRAGFKVFAYDHTGCMNSEGENTGGFGRSLSDLNCCISALKEKFGENMRYSVIGHSWGGYSTLNVCAFHPDVESIVAISGFASVKRMVKQAFSGLLSPFSEKIYAIERGSNPDTVYCDAADSLAAYTGKALIIHSYDDGMVSFEKHFAYLAKALANKDNVRFLAVSDKKHNPNYTADAVKYLGEYGAKLQKALKKGNLSSPEDKAKFVASFDWYKMTEQDEALWSEIIKVLS